MKPAITAGVATTEPARRPEAWYAGLAAKSTTSCVAHNSQRHHERSARGKRDTAG